LDRFAEESSPRTWLFSILKHKLADHYRKVYREGKHVSGLEVISDDPDRTNLPPTAIGTKTTPRAN
jgi:DNA-directed RNA polymerase specialized sigma24 family protein